MPKPYPVRGTLTGVRFPEDNLPALRTRTRRTSGAMRLSDDAVLIVGPGGDPRRPLADQRPAVVSGSVRLSQPGRPARTGAG